MSTDAATSFLAVALCAVCAVLRLWAAPLGNSEHNVDATAVSQPLRPPAKSFTAYMVTTGRSALRGTEGRAAVRCEPRVVNKHVLGPAARAVVSSFGPPMPSLAFDSSRQLAGVTCKSNNIAWWRGPVPA